MQEEILIKYIQKQVDLETRERVEEWIAQSEENEKRFHELRDAWVTALYSSEASMFDADKAWYHFRHRVQENKKSRKMKRVLRWMATSAAAAVALFFGLTGLFDTSVDYNTHQYAESASFTLPDGSSVTLNEHSSIKYPERFLASQREITIFGEAFFEVEPDADRPFIVKAGSYRVKVLGTKFNVRKVRSDVYEVYVTEGKVMAYPVGDAHKAIILLPGDLAVLNEQQEPQLSHAGANYMSWKTNDLNFNNTSLKDVFETLENHYGKSIRAGKGIRDYKLTARFNDKTLDQALETIQIIFDIRIQHKENYILISANSPPENEKQME